MTKGAYTIGYFYTKYHPAYAQIAPLDAAVGFKAEEYRHIIRQIILRGINNFKEEIN